MIRLKRGQTNSEGLRFWYYKRGKEVWLNEAVFLERKAALSLRLKTKRESNPEWREKTNRQNSLRNKNPEVASLRLRKKRERYGECPDRRSKVILKNRQSRERLDPVEKRRRLDKHLDYCKKRYSTDPLFNLAYRVRRRIKVFLKGRGLDKRTATRQMIGCDTATLKKHLESLFVEGMSWSNKNQWHIDHIIPLASAQTEADILNLCHFSNLQPLWAKDNLTKGSKVP
jgi:hypothetical protein